MLDSVSKMSWGLTAARNFSHGISEHTRQIDYNVDIVIIASVTKQR